MDTLVKALTVWIKDRDEDQSRCHRMPNTVKSVFNDLLGQGDFYLSGDRPHSDTDFGKLLAKRSMELHLEHDIIVTISGRFLDLEFSSEG